MVYNLYRKGRSTENFTGIFSSVTFVCIYSWFKSCKLVPHLGVEDLDLTEQNQGILLTSLNEEVVDTSREAAIDDPYQTDGGAMLKYGLQRNMVDGEYLFT